MISILKTQNFEAICPDLFEITIENEKEYLNIYKSFSKLCNQIDGKINLCGLSLGGVLALEYAKEFPHKINSIILIGTPYKIPKFLFYVQNLIFKIMPESAFGNTKFSKKDFIILTNSMKKLKIQSDLNKIQAPTLVLCGEKDRVNTKSAKLLSQHIPNSRLKTVSGASHEVNTDNPVELAQVIGEFWSDNNEKR